MSIENKVFDKNKSLLSWGFLLLLILGLTATTARNLALKKSLNETKYLLEIAYNDLSYERSNSSSLKQVIELSHKYNGQIILDEPIFASTNDTINLFSIIGNSPILVLRFSEISCNVCIDSQIDLVNSFLNRDESVRFMLIASYSNPEHMIRFKRLNNIDYEIYNFGGSLTGFNENDVPFYFIIDKDHVVKDSFIPVREVPSLTESYFSRIKLKYFTY
jgi:hypothetical protein